MPTWIWVCYIHLMSPLIRVLKNIFKWICYELFLKQKTLLFSLFLFQIFFQNHHILMIFCLSFFSFLIFQESVDFLQQNALRKSFDSFHSVSWSWTHHLPCCPHALSFYGTCLSSWRHHPARQTYYLLLSHALKLSQFKNLLILFP